MRAIARPEEINLGFQIAPMIDVVFVIMLFFMVMASTIKRERMIGTKMPSGGGVSGGDPDELLISIEDDGAILLNEEEIASSQDVNPWRLTQLMTQIREQADERGSKTLVTVQADPQTRYQRTVDVLNSLAKAKITNVTFTVGSDEP